VSARFDSHLEAKQEFKARMKAKLREEKLKASLNTRIKVPLGLTNDVISLKGCKMPPLKRGS